jgi:uncharacterized protein (TIGR00251 family)
VRVIPRSGKNEVAGVLADGTVKIRLAAPPVEGKANEALVRFLAETLGVRPNRIEIVGGATGRNKLVVIAGLEAAEAERLLREAAGSS